MISAEILRILFGLVAVIGLIAITAMAAQKLGLASGPGGFSRKRRLMVVETLALDTRRRMAIIKCDGAEHLIILGVTGETVVARNLDAAAMSDEGTADENPFTMSFADLHNSISIKLRPSTNEDRKNTLKDTIRNAA